MKIPNFKKSRSIKKSQYKKSKIIGGKPLFRHIDKTDTSAKQTLIETLGLSRQIDQTYILSNVRELQLIANNALYSNFYCLTIENNRNIININIDNNPVYTPVNKLGLKICLISPEREMFYLNEEKKTVTVASFHQECLYQYNVFSLTYKDGANSLTPGIIYTEIQNNKNSIITIHNYLIAAQIQGDPETIESLNILLQVLTENPNWGMGSVFMEYVPNSITMQVAFDESNGLILRQLCLRNMHRWALLRIAHKTNLLHRDFHTENALYSQVRSPGFFHNMDGTPIDESIQIIDWGRTMQNPRLTSDIYNLFMDLRKYIITHPALFTHDIIESNTLSKSSQSIELFNSRITDIFNRWLHIANFTTIPAYNWVVDTSPNQIIDAHLIMYYEFQYLIGRKMVNRNTYATIVEAPDRQILSNINNLINAKL
jgi:hypothetical protein